MSSPTVHGSQFTDHSSRRCVLVLGMGRSGTSAISSSLLRLGFFGGDETQLIGPDEGNEDGYYELSPFADHNDRIRTDLGMKYNICLGCPPEWEEYENMRVHVAKLERLIQTTFGDHDPWLLKDPRISLLLPIYESVLSDLGIRPTLVLCVRNPLNVAASFHKRFGAPVHWAVAMWLQHTLTVLEASRRHGCRVVSYEGFLKDPIKALAPLVELFPSVLPSKEAWGSLNCLKRTDLNHGTQPQSGLDELKPAAIKRTFDLCLRAANDPPALDAHELDGQINELWEEFQAWWTLPPYEKILASRLRLTYSVNGATQAPEVIYIPKRRPQTFEIPFEAPAGARVEAKLCDWPGVLFLRDIHIIDSSGNKMPLALERAADIISKLHPEGEIWTLPRTGNHFRFAAPGGKCVFSITFSIIAEPVEAARLASESWLECLALRRRVAELEDGK